MRKFIFLCITFMVIFSTQISAVFTEPNPMYEAITYDIPMFYTDWMETESEESNEVQFSDADIELIALITMAEAEGECVDGQRLVIDVILDRVDSEYFPNTVYEVIYEPLQFSCVWNGRINECEVQKNICQLVREEIESRTNYDVIFFSAGWYSAYGVPMFQLGNHYFSSYN